MCVCVCVCVCVSMCVCVCWEAEGRGGGALGERAVENGVSRWEQVLTSIFLFIYPKLFKLNLQETF